MNINAWEAKRKEYDKELREGMFKPFIETATNLRKEARKNDESWKEEEAITMLIQYENEIFRISTEKIETDPEYIKELNEECRKESFRNQPDLNEVDYGNGHYTVFDKNREVIAEGGI